VLDALPDETMKANGGLKKFLSLERFIYNQQMDCLFPTVILVALYMINGYC